MRTDIARNGHQETAVEAPVGMPAEEGRCILRSERGKFHPAAWGFLDRLDAAEEAAGRLLPGAGA